MRRKEDQDRIYKRNADRVCEAVGRMSAKEREQAFDGAHNITFKEMTDKLHEMDKIACKDKWTDQELKDMVEFSAMLYVFVMMCKEFDMRVGGRNPLEGVNISIFKLGG